MKKNQFPILVFERFVVLALLFIAVSQPANADPLTAGNILVTSGDTLFEYTPFGIQVQSIAVPCCEAPPENARDIIVDQNGNVQVYNGTADPFLSTYNPSSDTWMHHTHPGWSTVANSAYGGIGTYQNFVYVTDMRTYDDSGADEAKGIIRFNIDDFSSQRFAEAFEFIDLTVGIDGLVYGLSDEYTVNVYDPLSMELLRTISLATGVRGIAVNEAGDIFGASWDDYIYHFDNNGVIQKSINSGSLDPYDIDISLDGQLVVGSRFGDVILTDESLGSVSSFNVGFHHPFVAYVPAQPTYDATGIWSYSSTSNWAAGCLPYYDATGTVTVTQTGNDVTLVDDDGYTWTGTVNGADYTLSTSFPEDGGTTTANLSCTLSSSTSGSGTVIWSWTDGIDSCSGGFDVALTKEAGGGAPPVGGGGGGGG